MPGSMKEQIGLSLSISTNMNAVDENIARGIGVGSVRDRVRNLDDSFLVLDCRPFIAYNTRHIVDALNVYCPPILKRRSNGFVALENIVTCEKKRKLLQDGHFTSVVVYDDDTTDLASSAKDSNLYSVLKSLRQQVDLNQVEFIIGGFKAFQREYPDLCTRQTDTPVGLTLAPPPNCHSTSKLGPVEILPGLYLGDSQHSAQQSNLRELGVAALFSSPEHKVLKLGPVEILAGLYLGDSQHSAQQSNLRELGVTALLNVSTNCKNFFEGDFAYMNIPVNDNDTAVISSWFNEAIEFIDKTRDNGGKVLVHCQAGVSRSATVCIAYLMYKNNLTLEKAFDFVRAKRGVISPNLNFMQQLLEFEKNIFTGAKDDSDIQDSVSSISNSLASVEFDFSCSSTSASDFSSSSGTFEFSFASPQVPPVSPRELVSPS